MKIKIILVILVIVLVGSNLIFYVIIHPKSKQEKELSPKFLVLVEKYKQTYNLNNSYINCIFENTCNGTFYLEVELEEGSNISGIVNIIERFGEINIASGNLINFRTKNFLQLNDLLKQDFIKNVTIYMIKSDRTIKYFGEKLYACKMDNDCIKIFTSGCSGGIYFINKYYEQEVLSQDRMNNVGIACGSFVGAPTLSSLNTPKCLGDRCQGVYSQEALCKSQLEILKYVGENQENGQFFSDSNLTYIEIGEICDIELGTAISKKQENNETQEKLTITLINPSNNSIIKDNSINIGVNTNEKSICSISGKITSPFSEKDLSKKEMQITGEIFHSHKLENLEDGSRYIIEIICRNISGEEIKGSLEFKVSIIMPINYIAFSGNNSNNKKFVGAQTGKDIYNNDFPFLLGVGQFYSDGSLLIFSVQNLGVDYNIINTTNIFLEINSFTYEIIFSKSVNFSTMHISLADPIEMLRKFYKVQDGSNNTIII